MRLRGLKYKSEKSENSKINKLLSTQKSLFGHMALLNPPFPVVHFCLSCHSKLNLKLLQPKLCAQLDS